MKINIHQIKKTIEDAYPAKMVTGKALPVKKKVGHGRKRVTKKFHRWMMSSLDRMFSAELTGRRNMVYSLQFTVFAGGEPLRQGLDTVITAVRSVYPEWDAGGWLMETAVAMQSVPEGGTVDPVKGEMIELIKLDLRGVPVLFIKVS